MTTRGGSRDPRYRPSPTARPPRPPKEPEQHTASPVQCARWQLARDQFTCRWQHQGVRCVRSVRSPRQVLRNDDELLSICCLHERPALLRGYTRIL